MKTERPVYLSLTQFGWPFTAIASITHRVTGVVLLLTEGEPVTDDDSVAGAVKGPRILAAPALLRDGGGIAASVRF